MKFLAFDFGDGTTSAALCEGGEPVAQNIIRGEDEIPSVLNYCVGGDGKTRAVIGFNAVNVGETQAGLRMNWKSRPTQMEPTPGYPDEAKIADTTIFMQTVYREFIQQNPGAVDEQTRIVIGTPSAWTEDDRGIYATYAERAGLKNVSVLSESQAAYLYAQKFLKDSDGNCLPSSIIRDGLLIVDVGSSTTDFTFARGMHSEHYGVALGAKYVDENLFKWGLLQSDADDEILSSLDKDENREIRLRLVFKCRERKEQYFALCHPGERTQRVPDRVEELIGDEEISFRLGDLEKGRTMSEALFQRLLDDGCEEQYEVAVRDSETGAVESCSWRGHFRKALRHVAEKLVSDGLDKVSIVLTGGASRMYFIDEDIRKVFGAGVKIFAGLDKDRSFSVVKGLAWAGYAVSKVDDAINKLKERIDEMRGDVEDEVCSKLVNGASDRVRALVKGQLSLDMKSHLSSVRSRAMIRTHMQDLASEFIAEQCRLMTSEIPHVFDSIMQSNRVKNLTEDIVKEFGRIDVPYDPPKFVVGNLTFQRVNVSAIDLNTLWDDFRSLWTDETTLDNEYLDADKLDSIESYLDMDFQKPKWDELRASVRSALTQRNGGSFLLVVCDLILANVYKAKCLELMALKGVFSGDR